MAGRYIHSSMKCIYISTPDGFGTCKICHSNAGMKSCRTPFTSTNSLYS